MTDPDHNPFALLGVEPRFDLDEQELQRRFIAASAESHPDRSTDPEQQAELARRAAQINRAYRTLCDLESRGNALLDLLGGPSASAEKTLPEGLLEEMLDVRERMDQAQSTGDRKELHELEDWAQSRRERAVKKIAKLFRSTPIGESNADTPDLQILRAVRIQLNGLRYYLRMIEQLDPDYDPNNAL